VSKMRLGHAGLNRTSIIMKKHVDGKYEYCNSQETDTRCNYELS